MPRRHDFSPAAFVPPTLDSALESPANDIVPQPMMPRQSVRVNKCDVDECKSVLESLWTGGGGYEAPQPVPTAAALGLSKSQPVIPPGGMTVEDDSRAVESAVDAMANEQVRAFAKAAASAMMKVTQHHQGGPHLMNGEQSLSGSDDIVPLFTPMSRGFRPRPPMSFLSSPPTWSDSPASRDSLPREAVGSLPRIHRPEPTEQLCPAMLASTLAPEPLFILDHEENCDNHEQLPERCFHS